MYEKQKNEKDVLYILKNLRPEDEAEARVLKGDDYINVLLQEIMSPNVITRLGCKKSDDTPVCIGGYTDAREEGAGVVWLLATNEVENYKTCLLRNIIKTLKEADEKYQVTYNFLFSENKLAKSWLKKTGFRFDNPQGINAPEGFEFFYRIRPVRGLRG